MLKMYNNYGIAYQQEKYLCLISKFQLNQTFKIEKSEEAIKIQEKI